MVSHELRNPLSAIVQSSDVVLNSLKGLLAQESISSAMSHELSDDIETMKSIGLCTMHMRRLIDDTINVWTFLARLIIGIETRKWYASGNSRRLRTHDHRQANPTNIRCRTSKQKNRSGYHPRPFISRPRYTMGQSRSKSNFSNPNQPPLQCDQVPRQPTRTKNYTRTVCVCHRSKTRCNPIT